MNRQLTVQESRHRLARAICHGGRGPIRQAYREGQEGQVAALGPVLNAVSLWITRYPDAAEDDEDRRSAHATGLPLVAPAAWCPTCCDASAAGVTTSRVHSPGRVPWMPGDPDRRAGRRHAAPLRPGGCWSWIP
uniref:Transposase n=1 Tax=Streptomyces sp. NBC_01401 TaxID=2903854 RepID=A0AAU3H4N5_9ACTN